MYQLVLMNNVKYNPTYYARHFDPTRQNIRYIPIQT